VLTVRVILGVLVRCHGPPSPSQSISRQQTTVRRADEAEPPLTLRAARSLARSQTYQSAADAPATLRAYKADLANFKAWCVERKLEPMPGRCWP
jgi:hypothetical protein